MKIQARSAAASLLAALVFPAAIFPQASPQGPRTDSGGHIVQIVDATPFRGKMVLLRGAGNAEVSVHQSATMRILVYGKGKAEPAVLADQKDPITSREWRPYELTALVPPDAERLAVDLGLSARGKVWWDELSLTVDGEGEGTSALVNGDFEKAGAGTPAGWSVTPESERSGYHATLSEDHPRSGRSSLLFFYREPDSSKGSPRP